MPLAIPFGAKFPQQQAIQSCSKGVGLPERGKNAKCNPHKPRLPHDYTPLHANADNLRRSVGHGEDRDWEHPFSSFTN
jgi:hypothetical protein